MTDCVVFGGVTRSFGYVVQVVAVPVGLSVPSTIADANWPGMRVTWGALCPAPPRYPFSVLTAWVIWTP